jgi:pilus assembly protein FimV
MKPINKMRRTALGVALLLAGINSAALTLGRPRGAVIVGQPVDVGIPVRVEADEDASAQCYEADVFLGDTRVTGGRTTVTLEPGASPQDMTVRVRSTAIVDEPVVSIYLRAGCAQRSTRRYVLLADVATDVVSPLILPSLTRPMPSSASAAQLPAAGLPSDSGASPSARSGVRAGSGVAITTDTAPTQAAAERRRQRREVREAKSALAVPGGAAAGAPPIPKAGDVAAARPPGSGPIRETVVRRKVDAAAARSRLKLDPLDLLIEGNPQLKSSGELLTPVSENPQARAEAAAMWRALNATPLEILRDTQRLQGLEADVKSLRDATAKNQASLAEVQSRLQKAESERYANVLVYSLGGLLLAALALAALFWRRARGSMGEKAWWNGRDQAGDHERTQEMPMGSAQAPSAALTQLDVDLGMDENMFATLKPPATASPVAVPPPRYVAAEALQHSDFSGSMHGMSRAANAEELLDIQQQADFFVSLGQHEQAIEVLKNHISDNVETSALAYLDLLKIYHFLNRRAEYDLLRGDFNRVFNAQVPVFDSYNAESFGLESYHTAMSRIEALWPSAKVLEIIEESIFRKPGTGEGEAFDLEAYRELLLLYAIAKEVVDQQSEPADFEYSSAPAEAGDSQSGRKSRFTSTAIQPLSASNYSETSPAELQAHIPMPKPSPRLGLDIDLDAFDPADLPMGGTDEQPTDFDMHDFHSESIAEDIDSYGESRPPKLEQPAHDGQLIDFDLFDEAAESKLRPKTYKLPKS